MVTGYGFTRCRERVKVEDVIGIDTAKAVLNAPREMLIEKADLEENTVDDVLRVLRAEFEE